MRLANGGFVDEMKGGAPVTQEIIVWVLLLMGLVGLIWVMVLAILGGDHHTHDKRQGSASPEHRDGYEPRERSLQRSTVAV